MAATTTTVRPRSRFIKGEPPRSGRKQKRKVRADWKSIVVKARGNPGQWMVVERHPDIEVATSAFRFYDDIEAVNRGGTLYIRAKES